MSEVGGGGEEPMKSDMIGVNWVGIGMNDE